MLSSIDRRTLALTATLVMLAAHPGLAGEPPASGQAAGTLVVNGKTYTLAHAAAFVDQKDPSKPGSRALLLTDKPVPADILSGEKSITSSQMMAAQPFSGVVLWLDEKGAIVQEALFEKDDKTATSGMFAVKLDVPAGKSLSGAAHATDAAAAQKKPIQLKAVFNATVK